MKGTKLTGKRLWLVIGAVLAVAWFVVPAAGRALTAPWSVGLGGRNTLTRSWSGTLQARQGSEYPLYLDLDYKDRGAGRRRSRSRGPRSNLHGSALLCSRTGETYEYEVSGRANRSAAKIVLYVEYGDPKLSALNLQPRGKWKGDKLTLTSHKNPFLPDGTFVAVRPISSADPDDSFAPAELRPAGKRAFAEACRKVRGGGGV